MGAGRFLVLEGGEGAGKTTQAQLLCEWLEAKGLPVLLTRDPGGTEAGEVIRRLILGGGPGVVLPRAEVLLYLASRAQLVDAVIRPALEDGQAVISDRFVLSTLAYQGGGRGFDRGDLSVLNRFASGGLEPDLTILLDVPVEVGLVRTRARGGGGLDRIEREELAFHRRVRETYLSLVRNGPGPIVVVNAGQDEQAVATAVRAEVASVLDLPSEAGHG